jgi:hypothetical protein
VKLKPRQRAFLASFEITGQIKSAAKAVGIDRDRHYEWLEKVEGYPEAFKAAQEKAADALEDEAVSRAKEGVLDAVFYQGKPVGARRIYSDGLMMFLLRGMRPDKYRERRDVEVTGANGGPISTEVVVKFVVPDDATNK